MFEAYESAIVSGRVSQEIKQFDETRKEYPCIVVVGEGLPENYKLQYMRGILGEEGIPVYIRGTQKGSLGDECYLGCMQKGSLGSLIQVLGREAIEGYDREGCLLEEHLVYVLDGES